MGWLQIGPIRGALLRKLEYGDCYGAIVGSRSGERAGAWEAERSAGCGNKKSLHWQALGAVRVDLRFVGVGLLASFHGMGDKLQSALVARGQLGIA